MNTASPTSRFNANARRRALRWCVRGSQQPLLSLLSQRAFSCPGLVVRTLYVYSCVWCVISFRSAVGGAWAGPEQLRQAGKQTGRHTDRRPQALTLSSVSVLRAPWTHRWGGRRFLVRISSELKVLKVLKVLRVTYMHSTDKTCVCVCMCDARGPGGGHPTRNHNAFHS